jgi:hypothetical protein
MLQATLQESTKRGIVRSGPHEHELRHVRQRICIGLRLALSYMSPGV